MSITLGTTTAMRVPMSGSRQPSTISTNPAAATRASPTRRGTSTEVTLRIAIQTTQPAHASVAISASSAVAASPIPVPTTLR